MLTLKRDQHRVLLAFHPKRLSSESKKALLIALSIHIGALLLFSITAYFSDTTPPIPFPSELISEQITHVLAQPSTTPSSLSPPPLSPPTLPTPILAPHSPPLSPIDCLSSMEKDPYSWLPLEPPSPNTHTPHCTYLNLPEPLEPLQIDSLPFSPLQFSVRLNPTTGQLFWIDPNTPHSLTKQLLKLRFPTSQSPIIHGKIILTLEDS